MCIGSRRLPALAAAADGGALVLTALLSAVVSRSLPVFGAFSTLVLRCASAVAASAPDGCGLRGRLRRCLPAFCLPSSALAGASPSGFCLGALFFGRRCFLGLFFGILLWRRGVLSEQLRRCPMREQQSLSFLLGVICHGRSILRAALDILRFTTSTRLTRLSAITASTTRTRTTVTTLGRNGIVVGTVAKTSGSAFFFHLAAEEILNLL